MPELSRFYGIIVQIYYNDHAPPHFHARYQGQKVAIGIETLATLRGRLPPRAQGLVTEWASSRQEELREAWRKAQNSEEPGKITPLE